MSTIITEPYQGKMVDALSDEEDFLAVGCDGFAESMRTTGASVLMECDPLIVSLQSRRAW